MPTNGGRNNGRKMGSGEAVVRFNKDGTRKVFRDYVREVMEGEWDCIDKREFSRFIKDNI
jgi:hypothetical protein